MTASSPAENIARIRTSSTSVDPLPRMIEPGATPLTDASASRSSQAELGYRLPSRRAAIAASITVGGGGRGHSLDIMRWSSR
jgi:hypothetical protein